MSKKPALIALLGVACLCTPVLAGPKPAPKKPAAGPNVGASYVVGRKDSGRTQLTQAQVDEVLKSKVGEVEACWERAPDDKRKKDVNAILSLSIDDDGEVQTVEVAGVPEETERCVAVAAVAWEFPRTDVKADASSFTYPVALHAK
jgi:hypothetical protein